MEFKLLCKFSNITASLLLRLCLITIFLLFMSKFQLLQLHGHNSFFIYMLLFKKWHLQITHIVHNCIGLYVTEMENFIMNGV